MAPPPNFDTIYGIYAKQVYNLCLHYVQNTNDAEDITQEVFIKIHERLHTFKEDAHLKTWVYRITINQCLDFIKVKKTKKRFGIFTSLFHAESQEPLAEIADFNHPGVQLEDREEIAALFKAISSLAPAQQTALILHKIEGRSQKEVAEIMNTTPKAVESLLQRAKSQLQKKINSQRGI